MRLAPLDVPWATTAAGTAPAVTPLVVLARVLARQPPGTPPPGALQGVVLFNAAARGDREEPSGRGGWAVAPAVLPSLRVGPPAPLQVPVPCIPRMPQVQWHACIRAEMQHGWLEQLPLPDAAMVGAARRV